MLKCEPLISVIVPVYNVEKYLSKCIESIRMQTYKNLEIILVNDGSEDRCQLICEGFCKIDNRIKLLNKKNGGLSDARNVGLEISTGQYLTFIDSDDYITMDYIEYLYNMLKNNNADVSICNCYLVKEDESIISNKLKKNPNIKVMDNISAIETLLYQKEFTSSAWGKLYSTKVFENIYFPVGKLHEDVGTIYKVLDKSSCIVWRNEAKYYYLQRSNSIVNSNFNVKRMDYLEQTLEIIEYMKLYHKNLCKAAISRHFSACFQILGDIPNLKKYPKEVQFIKNEIRSYRKFVICDKKARYMNRIAGILSYLNINFLYFLIKFINN